MLSWYPFENHGPSFRGRKCSIKPICSKKLSLEGWSGPEKDDADGENCTTARCFSKHFLLDPYDTST